MLFYAAARCYLVRSKIPITSCAGCIRSNCLGRRCYQKEACAHFRLQFSYGIGPNCLVPLFAYLFLHCRTDLARSFSCVCFTTCILLRGFWTKLPCTILLTLASNWLGFSKLGFCQFRIERIIPPKRPPHKHWFNGLFIPCDFLIVVISLAGIQQRKLVAHLLLCRVLNHRK